MPRRSVAGTGDTHEAPPQGHWLRGCRDFPPQVFVERLVPRHKVIGFVDAATIWTSTVTSTYSPRHKVIGFVDAATSAARTRLHVLHVRHKVIGFVDAATNHDRDRQGLHLRHKVIGFVDAATTAG